MRVCADKKNIGTWDEVASIINEVLGSNRTESYYRKIYAGTYRGRYIPSYNSIPIKAHVKANTDSNDFTSSQISKLDEKRVELEIERKKLQTTKVEYNRILRLESRFELFYELIAEQIKALPKPDFEATRFVDSSDKEYLLTIADIHMGAKFESKHNSYSIDICKERFQYLLNQTMQFVKEHGVSKLNILCLGDCVQGILRMTDLKLNEISVVQSVVEVSNCISSFLNELSAYCDIEYYHTPTSNHTQTRPLGTSRNEVASEDVEYIIGHYIKDMLRDNESVNVNLNFGEDNIEFKIFDFNCIALHGHTIKNVNKAIRDLSAFNKKFYDFVVLGHFHSGMEMTDLDNIGNDCEILVSPSFIGSDPYSDSLMLGSKASCKIYGFDEVSGHTETYKIVLN